MKARANSHAAKGIGRLRRNYRVYGKTVTC